jgi:hypothetical protein
MNDVGNVHAELGTLPLGIEVRVLAFSFDRTDALGSTTFYRYTILNKSGTDIEDTYVSVFSDPDLGDAVDDYIGSVVDAGLGYAYNADNADLAYGTPPPAVGYDLLQGPIVPDGSDAGVEPDTLLMSAFSYIRKVGLSDGSGDPHNGAHIYNFQQGLWGDGTAMRAYGDGYQEPQGAVTTFAFPGDPVTSQWWSERNPFGTGPPSPNAPGDRRFALHTGPFTLASGASQDVVLGIVFAQGTSFLNSVTALRAADATVQAFYDADFVVASEGAPRSGAPLAVAPNPFTTEARVSVGAAPGAEVHAVLFDVLGRQVAAVHAGPLSGDLRVSGAGLAPGVYVLRVRAEGTERAVRLVRR